MPLGSRLHVPSIADSGPLCTCCAQVIAVHCTINAVSSGLRRQAGSKYIHVAYIRFSKPIFLGIQLKLERRKLLKRGWGGGGHAAERAHDQAQCC